MRSGTRGALLLMAAVSFDLPVAAQWLNYPTPNVPRLADSQPNLNAPAPRTPDGKPDFSGIWYVVPPTNNSVFGGADYAAGPDFLDLGSKVPGGLPYQPWAAALVAQRSAAFGKDDPVGLCRPGGALRLLTFPPPRKFVQIPGLLLLLSERDVTFRQVFTDGRPLASDPEPTWNGYSTGTWQGDTLVVQSNGFRDDTWLDRKGSPMTASARLTERYRRPTFGRLEIEVTVDDPKAYLKPWTVTLQQTIVVDTELMDYHCADNDKFTPRAK